MYGKNHILAVIFYVIGISYILAKSIRQTKTEVRKSFKVFIIVLFFVAILAASLLWDWYTFRTDREAPYPIAGITNWLWLKLLVVWALPKKWIVGSLVVGALMTEVIRVIRERQRLRELIICSSEQEYAIFNEDKSSIENRIRITYISYRPDFEKSHVDFSFHVFNNSLYDIVIDKTLGQDSFITYDFGECDHPRFQYPPIIESNKIIRCPSRGTCGFIVRQPIRQEGLEPKLKTDDALIQFSGLNISFRVANDADGNAKRLRTLQHILETKRGGWSGDDPAIVFGLTEEQWAAVQSGQPERLTEIANLKKEVETLKEELQRKEQGPALRGPDIIARKPYFAWVAKESQLARYTKVGKGMPQHSGAAMAGFLDLFCQPTEGTVNGIDLGAIITFRAPSYERIVDLGAWYLRDNPKVPFRHDEAQTLFLVLYDGTFSTYENQSRAQPIENPIEPEVVYAHIRLFGQYPYSNKTFPVSINFWVRLSRQGNQLIADNIDEPEFIAATRLPD